MQAEQRALLPLPRQLARWAELAETGLPALPSAAEHPSGAAATMRALAPRIAAGVNWMIGIDVGAGHGHSMFSGASHPMAAAMKLSLACAVITV